MHIKGDRKKESGTVLSVWLSENMKREVRQLAIRKRYLNDSEFVRDILRKEIVKEVNDHAKQ